MLCALNIHTHVWKELPWKINFKAVQFYYYQRYCIYGYC